MLVDSLIVAEVPAPAAEYCFLWIQHWSMCMTKSEWSGWAQATGSFIALLIAIGIPMWQRASDRRDARYLAYNACLRVLAIGNRLTNKSQLDRKSSLRTCRNRLKSALQHLDSVPLSMIPMDALPHLHTIHSLGGALQHFIDHQIANEDREVGLALEVAEQNAAVCRMAFYKLAAALKVRMRERPIEVACSA